MSISNPRTEGKNPAKKFITYKGSTGKFQYYDKATEKNVDVPLPIEFVMCDDLSTIKGWSDKHQSGIYSNEVHDTTLEELSVKYFKGGEFTKGIYQNIKGDILAAGGRYAKSIYAIMSGELVNITLIGTALSSWIEMEVGFTQPKFKVEKTKEGKKGATIFQTPIFESVQSTDQEWEEAKNIDKEILQPYFAGRNKPIEVVSIPTDEVVPLPVDDRDANEEIDFDNLQ